ncbi:MAG TPA: hypothetical protein PLM07_00195 [Candidatus Rifleibacterium sp.]|nr:hypothetical protein [Candidatus Rifleibacterium sp.]
MKFRAACFITNQQRAFHSFSWFRATEFRECIAATGKTKPVEQERLSAGREIAGASANTGLLDQQQRLINEQNTYLRPDSALLLVIHLSFLDRGWQVCYYPLLNIDVLLHTSRLHRAEKL